jgi:hypothetical protein
MSKYSINYDGLASKFLRSAASGKTAEERRGAFTSFLFDELAEVWCEKYRRMPNGRIEIVQLTDDDYKFLFDLAGERVIAAFSTSRVNPAKRDSSRMAGFLGKVGSNPDDLAQSTLSPEAAARRQHLAGLSFRERFFETHGDKYDRGHFMSHRPGGGLDINLFPQRADIKPSTAPWSGRASPTRVRSVSRAPSTTT